MVLSGESYKKLPTMQPYSPAGFLTSDVFVFVVVVILYWQVLLAIYTTIVQVYRLRIN